MVSNKLFTL